MRNKMDERCVLLVVAFILQINPSNQRNITQFPPLSLYIGTDGDGFGAGSLPLGVQSPYGALRLGADTSNTLDVPIVFDHLGGYHYSDSHINLFSHTHMFGAGVVDYGEVGIIPVQVDNTKHLQEMISKRNGYRSAFQHEREVVEPGYYQVYLDTHKIKVELTATEQVGIHRYSYDKIKNKQHVILLDSSYTLQTDACNESHVKIDSNNHEISGSILFRGSLSGRFGGVTTYFFITLNTNWTNFGIWNNGKITEGESEIDGCSSGAYIILPDESEQVTMYVGISFISIEQARTNLHMQTNMFQPFDSMRTIVQQKWLDELSRFEV
jgi:putative alpha-1,2-mannosidase